jgi:hypothetical protein
MMQIKDCMSKLDCTNIDSSDSEWEINDPIINSMIDKNSNPNTNNNNLDYKLPYATGLDYSYQAIGLTEEELKETTITENSVCYKRLHNGDLFYRLTALQPVEYIQLVQLLEPLYTTTSVRNPNFSEEIELNRRNYPASICSRKLDCANALLLYIISLDGVDFSVLASMFDLESVSSVFHYLELMGQLVKTKLEGELKWPDAYERKQLYGLMPTYEKAIGVLDGTHCRIKVPLEWDAEDSYFSYYKNYHTQSYLLISDAYGFVIYLDGPFAGKRVDQETSSNCELIVNQQNFFSAGERVLADGGFRGIARFLIPYRANEIANEPAEAEGMKAYNATLGNTRARIEHCIHRLKARANSLIDRYNRDKSRQKLTVLNATLLHNWARRVRISKQMA